MNTGDVKFVTLLQFSAYKGNKELVQHLLGKGTDPNIEGECCHVTQSTMADDGTHSGVGGDCRTALHTAAGQWYLDIAFILAEKIGDEKIAGA